MVILAQWDSEVLGLNSADGLGWAAGFYQGTFVYSRFSPKIQFFYCLISSVALSIGLIVYTVGNIFEI